MDDRKRIEPSITPIATAKAAAVLDWSQPAEAVSGLVRGETTTYAGLAGALGVPRGARAVARALATNPVLLLVPCHRVIGADGSLRGYAGGIARKRALLELEGALDG